MTTEGELVVNEIAPRPHNSGHYTIDACVTSQFEQQARVLAGLPLGDARQHEPAVMVNLLGDVWFAERGAAAREPEWADVLRHPGAKLHLYGKDEPRRGRKMGHVTCLGPTLDAALETARAIKRDLMIPGADELVIREAASLGGKPFPKRGNPRHGSARGIARARPDAAPAGPGMHAVSRRSRRRRRSRSKTPAPATTFAISARREGRFPPSTARSTATSGASPSISRTRADATHSWRSRGAPTSSSRASGPASSPRSVSTTKRSRR